MEKDYDNNKKKRSIFSKIFIPMLILVIFQLFCFLIISLISGEFSYIKDYAQNVLVEKTENRKNYIEDDLQQKTSLVLETAETIDSIVQETLLENGASIEDITTDKELNKKILENSTESLIMLLRRDMVNDVFLILETEDLYDSDDSSSKAGMLIRDLDPSNNSISDNKDLLMEMGSSNIAQEYNITLDSGWASRLVMDDSEQCDFYFTTIETAKAHPNEDLSDLGYWSGLSNVSTSVNAAQPSIKYSIPLIDSDGNVYGVLGIGILEKMILKSLPSNDLVDQKACYILGYDKSNSSQYSIVLHSGSIYSRLVDDDDDLIDFSGLETQDLFEIDLKTPIMGSIQNITLYNSTSMYYSQKWALISIADKNSVLKLYNTIVRNFLISTIISAVLSICILLLVSRRISKPISNIADKLNSSNNYNETITFDTSNVTEIDRLTEAITSLQVNVKESASMVSKVISVSKVGMGVFAWDVNTDIVFIGESLISLLNLSDLPKEDAYIHFNHFMKYLSKSNRENDIVSSMVKIKSQPDLNEVAINETITFTTGNSINTRSYLTLNIVKDKNNIIGIVQDVTKVVLEKQKIEYERDYDLTTGLLNRRAYYTQVEKMFSDKDSLKVSAFIMWDLDNLKYVNDTYGHDFGDDYIKTAANVFKQFKSYNGIVARMSGDEFNVFLSGYDSKEEILNVVNAVRDNLLNSYCLLSDGTHFKIRASGGISYYPQDSTSYEMLIKYADFAMYTIKHSTKGAIAEFDISTYNKDSILVTGIEEMNRIIDEHSIKYAFQSIVSAKTGDIYGYEALMRPQSTIIKSPLDLIRIAKSCSKLYKIERLTWIEALNSFHAQMDEGKAPKGTKIFLNSISNCIISKEDVRQIEASHSEILSDLVMEILEGEQSNMDFMKTKFKLVKEWNGKIALDDFGSGYNNEYALITFDPYIIKIDRAIISGCDNDTNRQNIITSLVTLAKVKSILVLAEGVETYDELQTVIECGVDLIQGYYIGRPCFELKSVPQEIKSQIKNINLNTDRYQI